MTIDTQESTIEHVRTLKEENAAEHGYSLKAIIASARERQETSGRRIIRLRKGEPVAEHELPTGGDSDSK